MGGDDDYLVGYEFVGEFIKVGEFSRNVGYGVVVSFNGFKFVKGVFE